MSNSIVLPTSRQENIPPKWRDLDLSTDNGLELLDRCIAHAIGYHIYTGETHGKFYAERWNPVDKWERTFWSTEFSDFLGSAWHIAMPRYSLYVDSALKLVDQQPDFFELTYSPDRLNWRAGFGYGVVSVVARTSALAVCLAWLEYKNENGGQR